MKKHDLFILIAVAIIFCLATLSDANVDKSNLVKRKQDSPYRPYGIYNYKDKKQKKKKHKNKNNKKRHHLNAETIEKRGDNESDPDLGEVSIRADDKAALLKKRQTSPPSSTGHVDVNKIFPSVTSNP